MEELCKFENVFVKVSNEFLDKLRLEITRKFSSISNFCLVYNFNRLKMSWVLNKRNGLSLKLFMQLCEIFELGSSNVIKGIYSWGSRNPPVIFPNFVEINEFFVEGYSLYLAEGDTGFSGKTKPRKARFTNSELDIIYFFSDWLKEFFPKISFYLVRIYPYVFKGSTEINDLGIRVKDSFGKYNKIPKYRLCVDNSIVIDFLLSIELTVKGACIKNKNLAAAYLRGLMAGEGTVYNNRFKYVRIEMKNPLEINYAKKLFDKLGITYTYHIRPNRKNMENLYIGGKDNLKRYYDLVGFGSNIKRQEKLKSLILSY